MKPLQVIVLLALSLLPRISPAADAPRAVVLARLVQDGRAVDAAMLESAAIAALREKGLRVVELDAALAAQRAALFDSVEAGKVPASLSVLEADAILSVQLSCDRGAEQMPGTGIFAFSCALATKAVRVDSGDVTGTAAASWTRGAMTGAQAVQLLLKRDAKAALAAQADHLTAPASGFTLDLSVARLGDRERAGALARRLGALPGVESARLLVFGRGLAKYTVAGTGPEARRALLDALERDAELPLRITYETERLVHAELDFDRANRRPVEVYWAVSPAGAKSKARPVRENAPLVLGAALRNLGYLEPGEIRPLPDKLARGDARAALGQLARKDGPMVLLCRLAPAGVEWRATLELGAAGAGLVASGSAGAPEPLAALDQALRQLDASARQAFDRPEVRARLALPAQPAAAPEPLVVEAFEAGPVFPSRLPLYQREGLGRLALRNRSGQPLVEGRVRFALGATVLSEDRLPDLAPGASASVAVRLDALPPGPERFRQLAATITWRAGESYGKREAFAPLVLETADALDWSQPQSLAAFVDPSDPGVRALATAALGTARSGGIAPASRDAARLFDSLWHPPLAYVADPVRTAFASEVDTVQSPSRTLARGAGDCDDLTVLLGSLFESVGLATAVLVAPGHVLLGVDAGALAGGHVLYGLPRSRFVEVDGALFIPLEATAIGAGFAGAWQAGVKAAGTAGEKLLAYRTRAAWRRFPTVPQPTEAAPRLEVRPAAAQDWSALVGQLASGARPPVPAWSAELARALLAQPPANPIGLRSTPPGAEPLVEAGLAWLAGDFEKAERVAAQACAAGSAEACYDLAVMLSLDELEGSLPVRSEAARAALQTLPEGAAARLLEAGAGALGDEASEKAAAQRRLSELLKAVHRHADGQRAKKGWSGEAKLSAMAGRRGAPALEPRSAALLFFWAPVSQSPMP